MYCWFSSAVLAFTIAPQRKPTRGALTHSESSEQSVVLDASTNSQRKSASVCKMSWHCASCETAGDAATALVSEAAVALEANRGIEQATTSTARRLSFTRTLLLWGAKPLDAESRRSARTAYATRMPPYAAAWFSLPAPRSRRRRV